MCHLSTTQVLVEMSHAHKDQSEDRVEVRAEGNMEPDSEASDILFFLVLEFFFMIYTVHNLPTDFQRRPPYYILNGWVTCRDQTISFPTQVLGLMSILCCPWCRLQPSSWIRVTTCWTTRPTNREQLLCLPRDQELPQPFWGVLRGQRPSRVNRRAPGWRRPQAQLMGWNFTSWSIGIFHLIPIRSPIMVFRFCHCHFKLPYHISHDWNPVLPTSVIH